MELSAVTWNQIQSLAIRLIDDTIAAKLP